MTLRKIAIFAVAMPVLAGFFGCNTSYESSILTPSSVAVKSFSFAADDSVVANLDSVFFSIDLNKGLIFNADSLPFGTKVTRLIPVITTLETSSAIELKVTDADGNVTVHDYLNNSTDSIDFTNPVTLRVVSFDGQYEMSYSVKVNVHKMVSDSLSWAADNISVLPGNLSNPTAQQTAKMSDTFYCLTTDGTNYSLSKYTPDGAVVNGPLMMLEEWEETPVNFSFVPQINTFAATDDALYILADDGALYSSADEGSSWTATSCKWHHIYGAYGSQLIGSSKESGSWAIEYYPEGTSVPLPADMPVEGTSMPVSYMFPMSDAPQIVMVGGQKADGQLTSATWGYDGTAWADISIRPLPYQLRDMAVAMYTTYTVNGSWSTTLYPTLVAFGGVDSKGAVSSDVYVSNDYGCNWTLAPAPMQLPSYILPTYGAQTFVLQSTYSATIRPKIAKPTESWECPYIYMFGGYKSGDKFCNLLRRGTINYFQFAPIE